MGRERKKSQIKVILSGGGTGGHIYPAVSIADELRKKYADTEVEILFVGAEGKIEMTKVPLLGYRIIGLKVRGLKRKLTLENFGIIADSIKSFFRAKRIIREFRPDVVVGFGGYASFPLLLAAQSLGVRNYIWEGNSFAGLANRILGKQTDKAIVSFDKMERFFPKAKIVKLGTPIRGDLSTIAPKSEASKGYFGFDAERPTLLVTGGSLGAGTLNRAVLHYLDTIAKEKKINLIWQTGSYYFDKIAAEISTLKESPNIWMNPFIDNMKFAYEAADVVIARAGASTVTELALAGCAVIFVPSPNVTDDHQTKNAVRLTDNHAALLVREDASLTETLLPKAISLLENPSQRHQFSEEIRKFADPDAAKKIVNLITEQQ